MLLIPASRGLAVLSSEPWAAGGKAECLRDMWLVRTSRALGRTTVAPAGSQLPVGPVWGPRAGRIRQVPGESKGHGSQLCRLVAVCAGASSLTSLCLSLLACTLGVTPVSASQDWKQHTEWKPPSTWQTVSAHVQQLFCCFHRRSEACARDGRAGGRACLALGAGVPVPPPTKVWLHLLDLSPGEKGMRLSVPDSQAHGRGA